MLRDPTRPGFLLRLEGAAVIAVTLVLYVALGASGWLFLALILAPDISIAGYIGGRRVGAMVYNAVHTYALPAGLFALGFVGERATAMAVALIWAAHIGADRVLGFGLKYASGFRDTHLQRL